MLPAAFAANRPWKAVGLPTRQVFGSKTAFSWPRRHVDRSPGPFFRICVRHPNKSRLSLTRKEVVALTWADVSLFLKQIQVLMMEETTPDTRNKYQIVAINERQRICLKQMQAGPGIYVASGKDKPIWGCNLAPALNALTQELLLPPVVPSDLRRTFAVRSRENGMGSEELSRVLGVKNSSNFQAQFQALGTRRSPGKGPETRQPEAHAGERVQEGDEGAGEVEGQTFGRAVFLFSLLLIIFEAVRTAALCVVMMKE